MFRWTITIAYAAFIFYLSSLQSVGLPLFWQADKVIHAGLYFWLAVLCAWSLSLYKLPLKKILFWAFALTVVYGISDEFHQYFVPTRSTEILDVTADATGAFFGVLAFRFFYIRKRGRLQKS